MPKGKRGPHPEESVLPEPVNTTENSVEPQPERVQRNQKRLAIPLNDKGGISWENMRSSTREETEKFVRAMLTDRELAARMGIDKPLVEVFPAEWTAALYDALGAIESALAPKMFGISPEVAQQIFSFTPIEKEKLAKPTSAVINKHAADWMIRFKEEIALFMLLASIHYVKIMAAKMAQEMVKRQAQTKHPKSEEPRTDVN